jgi:cytochrome c oxidase cbb3-type subunit III
MRVPKYLLITSLFFFAAGCNYAPRPVADAASSPNSIPVGQIPGGVITVHYRTNPLANDPVALQDGRRLFNWYNCSGCHGGHAGGGMGPSLRDPVWLYGNRDDQIYDSIAQGRSAGMPAWGSKIPDIQIWELVAYIKSMGTSQEPDPPTEPANEMVSNPSNNTVPGIGMQTPSSEVKDNK